MRMSGRKTAVSMTRVGKDGCIRTESARARVVPPDTPVANRAANLYLPHRIARVVDESSQVAKNAAEERGAAEVDGSEGISRDKKVDKWSPSR